MNVLFFMTDRMLCYLLDDTMAPMMRMARVGVRAIQIEVSGDCLEKT